MSDGVSLYRLYDANYLLLYVGITSRKTLRQAEHADGKPWWHLVTAQDFEHYPDRESALAAEAEAIRTELPVFNLAGAVGGRQRRSVYELGRYDVIRRAQAEGRELRRRARSGEVVDNLAGVEEVPPQMIADAVEQGVLDLADADVAKMRTRGVEHHGRYLSRAELIEAIRVNDKDVVHVAFVRRARAKLRKELRCAKWVEGWLTTDRRTRWRVGATDVPLSELPGTWTEYDQRALESARRLMVGLASTRG